MGFLWGGGLTVKSSGCSLTPPRGVYEFSVGYICTIIASDRSTKPPVA